ncbi:hypothetical protein Cgig2_031029 [Carnegiea gigantea]|uniref:Uncharacterized protein n=1 Tax=Carnegiea gigantea TaxID=171969 RepID=A0A9Q1KD40_9CARY|nr:hypothetical protein Cgig2_031029 [Carnegiea gigantea]
MKFNKAIANYNNVYQYKEMHRISNMWVFWARLGHGRNHKFFSGFIEIINLLKDFGPGYNASLWAEYFLNSAQDACPSAKISAGLGWITWCRKVNCLASAGLEMKPKLQQSVASSYDTILAHGKQLLFPTKVVRRFILFNFDDFLIECSQLEIKHQHLNREASEEVDAIDQVMDDQRLTRTAKRAGKSAKLTAPSEVNLFVRLSLIALVHRGLVGGFMDKNNERGNEVVAWDSVELNDASQLQAIIWGWGVLES